MESSLFQLGVSSTQASISYLLILTLKVPETKIAEFANSIDLDAVAHDEPPQLDLRCLPSSL